MKELCKGPQRLAILPDLHAPFTNLEALSEALRRIKDYRPTRIILLGDTLDCLALSGYENSQTLAQRDDWATEVEKSAVVYEAISGVAKRLKVPVDELEGNHEQRGSRANNVPVQFQRALEINRVCPRIGKIRTGKNWTVHPYSRPDGILHAGGFVMMHGFGHGTTAGEKDALRARLALARLGKVYPWVVVCRGHQHALVPSHGGGPLSVRARGIDVGVAWMSPGTLGPINCGWDPAVNDSEWAPGVAFAEVDRAGAVLSAQVHTL